MNAVKINKTLWILNEIGQEVQDNTSQELDSSIFFKLKKAIDDLQVMIEKESIIEAKTKYFASVLMLAQIGARHYITNQKPVDATLDVAESVLEPLKVCVHDLYDVDADFEGVDNATTKQLKHAIDQLDSVILTLEIAHEV